MTAARGNCPGLRRTTYPGDRRFNDVKAYVYLCYICIGEKYTTQARLSTRASIFHDGFFDDIGVDSSVARAPRHQSFSSY